MTVSALSMALQELQSLPGILDYFIATSVAAAVNGSIVLLSGLAAWTLAGAWDRLRRELAGVEGLERSAPVPSEIEALLTKEDFSRTLAGGRVRLQRSAQGLADLQLIAASDSEELHQEVAVARAVAAAVVLLGLAGTLVGLSIGIGPLVDALKGTAPTGDALWNAMNQSMEGMKTAFSTTLLGVLSATVLGGGLTFYRRKQGKLLVRLERVSQSVLCPAYDREGTESVSELVEELRQVRHEFEESFSVLTERVEQRGENLSAALSSGFDDATAEIIHGFQELIFPFEQIRDATVQLVGHPDEGAEPLADQVARLGDAATDLERSVEAAERLIPELRETLLSAVREQSRETRESLEGYYGQMAERVAEQAAATQRLSDEVQRTSESVASVVQSFEDFSTAADEYQKVWSEVSQSVQQAERTLDSRLSAMGQAMEGSLGAIVEKQADAQQRVLSSLTDFERQLVDAIDTVERERRRSVSRSEELIRELRDAVKESIREIDARSAGNQEAVGRAIRQGLNELKLELIELLAPRIGLPTSDEETRDYISKNEQTQSNDQEASDQIGEPGSQLEEVFGSGGTVEGNSKVGDSEYEASDSGDEEL